LIVTFFYYFFLNFKQIENIKLIKYLTEMSIETIFKNIKLKKRLKFANIKLSILKNSPNLIPTQQELLIPIESNEIIPMEIVTVRKQIEIEYNKLPHRLRYKYLSMCNLNTDNQTETNKLLSTTHLEVESQISNEPSLVEINEEASEIEYLNKFPHKLRYKYLSKYKKNSILQAQLLSAASNINELNRIDNQTTNFTGRLKNYIKI
jgi:hypothetical protein